MPDPITRLNTALQDRYTIASQLGEGGMATVYLAQDLKHDRKVALKVLKPELAAVLGADRFIQEIKTTANLQHPHILPLFDSGEAGGFLFYVMPFIEGESLRERLDREKQLPVDEAIRITKEVAEALQSAHEQGVLHRDIKPANILLSRGRPLVADFGIALALSVANTERLTETGLSLGTPHYMSPEQATAEREVSAHSDLYSLACVLYEMLAGSPPHTGPTAQSVLVKILTEDAPPVTNLRRSVPGNVAEALTKALEKLPADRFESAAAFQAALADERFTYAAPRSHTSNTSGTHGDAPVSPRRDRRLAPLAAFAALAVIAAWGWLGRPDSPSLPPTTLAHIDLGDIQLLGVDEIVVSPDGSRFAVAGYMDGERRLFVRNADEEHFRPLLDVGSPVYPEFSPDGEWIVFYNNADDSILKIPFGGGAPTPVVPSSSDLEPTMPHWGEDGTIVFLARGRGVYRVPNTGGEAVLLASGQYWNPRLLPGGRGVVVTDGGSASTRYLDLAADTVIDLLSGGIDARYVDTGHLLYSDLEGALWAVPFDVEQGKMTGDAVPILTGLTVFGRSFARYAVSGTGTLVYGLGDAGRELLIVSLTGGETVPPLGPKALSGLRWSPNGETVAYGGGASDRGIYVLDLGKGTPPRRLTFGGNDSDPVWSPDGEYVAFGREGDGTDGRDLFVKAVNNDAPPEMLLHHVGQDTPSHWTKDGDLLFLRGDGNTDLWTVRVSDSTSSAPYLTDVSNLQDFQLSPGGDYAVYVSEESGTREVYVRSYPLPQQQVLVSEGAYPRWSPDGSQIYYWKGNTPGLPDSLFAASVRYDPSFAVLSAELVLSGEYILSNGWDLHPVGDRFIVQRDAGGVQDRIEGEGSVPERYVVVTNWFEDLKRRMEAGNR